MSMPRYEGGANSENGRDARLVDLLAANKRLAEAREALNDAAAEVRRAEIERLEAYRLLSGELVVTEGDILVHRDERTGKPFTILMSRDMGEQKLHAQRVTIGEVDRRGLWVIVEDGRELLLDIDSVHHPQSVLPPSEL